MGAEVRRGRFGPKNGGGGDAISSVLRSPFPSVLG